MNPLKQTIAHVRRAPPPGLGHLPGWCCFERTPIDGRIVYANGCSPQQDEAVDYTRLTTFEAAFDCFLKRGLDGLSFVVLPEFNLAAVEFPLCRDGQGDLFPDARRVAANAIYAERRWVDHDPGLRCFLRWPGAEPDWAPAMLRLARIRTH